MADIYFSNLDRSEVYRLPVLPEKFPELTRSAKNEEFETFDNGTFNIPGDVGLYTFSLERFLPALDKNYPFARSKFNPYLLINLWAGSMMNKTPIRVVMNRKEGLGLPTELLNMMFTVESMSHNEDKVHDVEYKVSFKEYRELS